MEVSEGQAYTSSPEVKFLRRQLDRLDPAYKCVAMKSFADKDVGSRI